MQARRAISTRLAPVGAAVPGWAGPYVLVLATGFLCYLALGTVLPALPRIVLGHLHAGIVALGLAVGAPSLTAVVAGPVGGWLSDRLGARRVTAVGAVVR